MNSFTLPKRAPFDAVEILGGNGFVGISFSWHAFVTLSMAEVYILFAPKPDVTTSREGGFALVFDDNDWATVEELLRQVEDDTEFAVFSAWLSFDAAPLPPKAICPPEALKGPHLHERLWEGSDLHTRFVVSDNLPVQLSDAELDAMFGDEGVKP